MNPFAYLIERWARFCRWLGDEFEWWTSIRAFRREYVAINAAARPPAARRPQSTLRDHVRQWS